jgi:SAM-dependent MidA family methyltransferase
MSLTDKIKSHISKIGYITIPEFMLLALSDPESGYYQQKQPFGSAGDFITAPEISQIFGEIIASLIIHSWQNLAEPNNFQITEFGPGNASLMQDILRVANKFPKFKNSISVNLIETSARLTKIQTEKLANFSVNITHHKDFSKLQDKQHFIIANEFFDALPISQFKYIDNKWQEIFIGLDNKDQFQYINLGAESDKSAIISQFINNPKENDIFEFSANSLCIINDLASNIKQQNSKALIIDYGYLEQSRINSIQALQNHQHKNIFHDIGNCDITSHVNFASFIEEIKSHKLNYSYTSQREFLINFGIKQRQVQIIKNANLKQKEKITKATNRLISKNQMGDLFKILLIES